MKLCVLVSLLVSHLLGILLLFIIFKTFKTQEPDKRNDSFIRPIDMFLKMKLISLIVFGSCYLIHCGLHIWKHVLENVNELVQIFSLFNYGVTVVHILATLLFSIMFYKRTFDHTSCIWCLCLALLLFLTYIGFTIDALSLDTLNDQQSNYTSSSQNVTRVVEVIELTKPMFVALKEFG